MADQALDITMLKDLTGKMVSPEAKRAAVIHMRKIYDVSEPRSATDFICENLADAASGRWPFWITTRASAPSLTSI